MSAALWKRAAKVYRARAWSSLLGEIDLEDRVAVMTRAIDKATTRDTSPLAAEVRAALRAFYRGG